MQFNNPELYAKAIDSLDPDIRYVESNHLRLASAIYGETILSTYAHNADYDKNGVKRDFKNTVWRIEYDNLSSAFDLPNRKLIHEYTTVYKKSHTYIVEGNVYLYELENGVYLTFTKTIREDTFETVTTCIYLYYDVNLNTHKQYIDLLIDVKVSELKKSKPKKNSMSILISTQNGYDLKTVSLAVKDLNIDMNYNDDFKPIHDIIVKSINEEERSGLIMLHGVPGTGKTNYIRNIGTYLESEGDRNLIFIPTDYISALSDPKFLSFMMSNLNNSIIILEDCETALKQRESVGNFNSSSVSNLLNFTDGLLGDSMNTIFIATFNCDLASIDKALMRKGRLIAKYEFDKLAPEKANALHQHLYNKPLEKVEALPLSDIYNVDQESFQKEEVSIGFKAVS